jgi:hypothetical protein
VVPRPRRTPRPRMAILHVAEKNYSSNPTDGHLCECFQAKVGRRPSRKLDRLVQRQSWVPCAPFRSCFPKLHNEPFPWRLTIRFS